MKLPVWNQSLPYPSPAEMPFPAGIVKRIAQDGRDDALPFLHDCTLAAFGGRLYLAWYNSTDAEICGSSLIRGRYTSDGGDRWSDVFRVVGEVGCAEEHFVPASLFTHGDRLYALITEMAGKNLTVSLGLFEAPANSPDGWRKAAVIAGGFLCNCPPVRMETGDYIAGVWMPMKEETPAFPAVLISQGDQIEKPWRCNLLYDPLLPDAIRVKCPEIGLTVEGGSITAYVRNDVGKPGDPPGSGSYVFTSGDYGESWSAPVLNPMPVGNSKIFSGILKDGRRYMVFNHDRGFFARGLLCITLTEPGEIQYSKVYKLFEDGEAEFGGRGQNWFYPCACEDGEHLYIACTMEEADKVRSAVIAKIPLNGL